MNDSVQSVDKTVSSMAAVLADYLTHQEIVRLTASWRQHSEVSVKMIQACVLDATTQYPRLRKHRSDIRKAFWRTALQMNKPISDEDTNPPSAADVPSSDSVLVDAFYEVMLGLKAQLRPAERQQVFAMLHHMVAKERTFKGQNINIMAFLAGHLPLVPDDADLLNNLVQLAYVCLCDVEGPVEADRIFYQVSEDTKAQHSNAIVECLF